MSDLACWRLGGGHVRAIVGDWEVDLTMVKTRMPGATPSTWETLLKEARAELDREDPDWGASGRSHNPTGRPQADPYKGAKTYLYLRADVVAWLNQEALRRGNGWTTSRIVNEALRLLIATEPDRLAMEAEDAKRG